jgi:predicted dehydrogenase
LKEIQKLKKKFPKEVKNITFGYIYLFNNHIHFIKKFIKNKKNGKILYIKFQRQNLGPIRSDVNVSYDLSTHDLSILMYLFNKKMKLINQNSYKILNKKISDISNLSFKIDKFYADINNSWLNPDKIRRIIIITSKKMLLFDEMNINEKIKIYNKYAIYPKIEKLKNTFFSKQAKIYEGNNFSPKIKDNDPLYDEIKNFLKKKNDKKDKFTGINFAENILKILKNIN